MNEQPPVEVELAQLPRDQIGPFLILGVEKEAATEQVEANWARRVIWARKNQFRIPLEDVNWAREVLTDPDKRVRADVTSFNPDTIEGVQKRLVDRLHVAEGGAVPTWQLADREWDLSQDATAVAVPDPDALLRSLEMPLPPAPTSAVQRLLSESANQSIHPWSLDLRLPPQDTHS